MRSVRVWMVMAAVLTTGLPATAASPDAEAAAASGSTVPDDTEAPRRDATRVQFSAAYERLSNHFDPWRSAVLSVQAGGTDTAFHGELREQLRYSLFDHELAAGVDRRLGRRLRANGELAVSPSHHVSPMWTVLGGLEVAAPAGWGARTSLQHRQYTTAGVDIGSAAVERYLGPYRLAYTIYVAHLQSGASAASQRVDGSVYYGAQSNSIGASLSAGEEIEQLPPFGVIRTPVRAVAIVGRQSLGRTWFLAYDVLAHRQGALYTRQRLSVGLGRWF